MSFVEPEPCPGKNWLQECRGPLGDSQEKYARAKVNFFDPNGWANGEALQAALHAQQEGPLRWVPTAGVLAVLGHSEAAQVLSDSERFTSRRGTGLSEGGTSGRSLNLDDAPRSLELRRLVQSFMDQPMSPDSQLQLVHRVDAAVARARAKGEADALGDLGEPIARGTFAAQLELTVAEVAELARLTEGLARSGLDRESQTTADGDLRALLRAGLNEARPGRFWELGREALRRGLTGEDAMFLLRLVVQTGHESTAQAIAGAIHAALEWNAPFDGGARAVQEWLRWTSPLVRFSRVATRDIVLAGVSVREGTRLAIVFPVVNRDPRVFEEPSVLRLDRAPNPHLAFGAGPHACAGARTARAQLAAVMQALSEGPRPALAGAPTRLVSSVTRGFTRVPLRFG
ncbi:MAG: cytochrome P450 [Archangiaceae bacterium]|nr:cytochrome P450 [Archangiaceae bacterium]